MTNSNDDGAPAVVAGDLDGAGMAAGTNPYELLSASLAACTATTIRLQARRRKFPLPTSRLPCRTTMAAMPPATPSSAPSGSKETLAHV